MKKIFIKNRCKKRWQFLVTVSVLMVASGQSVAEQQTEQQDQSTSEFMQQLMESSGAPPEAFDKESETQSDTSAPEPAEAEDSEQSTSEYLKQLMEASGVPVDESTDGEPPANQETEPPDSGHLRLQVAEPYIELFTGPGRGFPIFHVVDRNDWIELLKRRTEWFKVRASNGKVGWAHISKMELTLALPGRRTEFARIKHEDYMQRKYEYGVLAGDFDGANLMSLYASYILTQNLAVEFAASQATGTFINSELYDLHLVSTPFPQWRFTPYFALGMGHLRNKPRKTFLTVEETSDVTASAGFGIRGYLTRRFVFRANVREVIVFVDDDDNGDLIEWKLGFSFFF